VRTARIIKSIALAAGVAALAHGREPTAALPASDAFLSDLTVLVSTPHRLAGSAEGRQAMAYIERRLRRMGINDVFVLDVPTWTLQAIRCELTVDSVTVPLLMARPDLQLPPVTGPEGISGPLIYAGNGELWEYGSKNVENAIVALEYGCGDTWRRAFACGAQAVIFIGSNEATPLYPRAVNIPANIVRLYAPPESVERIDLRADHPRATIVSHARWVKSTARNVIAYIPGTNPHFSSDRPEPEMMVLSANVDSWGEVPHAAEGARGAANVAALIEAAGYFAHHRPRRDVVFAFFDASALYHEGARQFYDALMRKDKLSQQLWSEHREQHRHVEELLSALRDPARLLQGQSAVQNAAVKMLMNTAYTIYSDLNQELIALRIRTPKQERDAPDFIQTSDRLQKELDEWNEALGALDDGAPGRIEKNIWNTLRRAAMEQLGVSHGELTERLGIDDQERALRGKLGGRWIVLHAAYNFSGEGPCWGPVAARDDLLKNFYTAPSSDNAGFYPSVFKALRSAARKLPPPNLLQAEALKDPLITARYVPGKFTDANHVAGIYGMYNLVMMTYHDARRRDGHPADNLANLRWQRLRRQAAEATRLLHTVACEEDISLPRVFSDVSFCRYPRWSGGRSTGYYAGVRVSGSLAEDRPASDAVMVFWPRQWGGVWSNGEIENIIPAFNRYVFARIDANGRFGVVSVRNDHFTENANGMTMCAAMFDSLGQLTGMTNQTTLGMMLAVNMFPARGYWCPQPVNGLTEQTKILRGASDASFRQDRSLCDAFEMFSFFCLHPHDVSSNIKIFQPFGAVLLAPNQEKPTGNGYPIGRFTRSIPVDSMTPSDMWNLNESRLSLLRSKGVMNVDLEVLHSRAKQLFEKANRADSLAVRLASFAQSSALSRLVYYPLRMVMDDLIRAVVILLLLAIPFAFALERLLVCATSVYTRLAGFAAAFLATFILMYFMHPGFQIASTPIIVFLAFTIILLTSLVIYIMMRKFRTELMAFQGRAASVHSSEISRMGTMIAAVNMGMSTMRRRPVRTFLTCVTVVMLTFTILCFSSFASKLGVRIFYEGPAASGMKASFFIRRLDYGKLDPDVLRLIYGREGRGGLTAAQWWKAKIAREDTPFGISRTDAVQEIFVDGIMGVPPDELAYWDDLADIFEGDSMAAKIAALRDNGVFLPSIMRDYLNLRPGDTLLVNGYRMCFAGTFDVNKVQRLKNLDGKSVLPVDFQDVTYKAVNVEKTTPAATVTGGVAEMAQRDFMRLSANQVAITSADAVRRQGGTLHTISIYSGSGVETGEEGQRLAELTALPLWARGGEGVQRMVFTRLADVTGGFALLIPVVLGGLIIFGTLLGSITDRQREIYTFSALGLSPGHVGFLFFAEAAVYAIIGGVGGMLLAQGLGLAASRLAEMGYIQQASINFSSTNSLAAIAIVMATVLVSAIYPAIKASGSANPGVQRTWKMPAPVGDKLEMTFPFTVSSYDITGVVSFLSEHFGEHDDAGFGLFAAQNVKVSRDAKSGNIQLAAHVSLAPFDLGIAQDFTIMAAPSEIPGIDEVMVRAVRTSGSVPDWKRANKVFIRDLRKQFLLWRTLSPAVMESYRMRTLQALGETEEKAELEIQNSKSETG